MTDLQGGGIKTAHKAAPLPKASKDFRGWSMTEEVWLPIPDFPGYSVSNLGRIHSDRFDRNLSLSLTQYGLVQVGMMRDGKRWHRSLPLLVAKAFVPEVDGPFDTPINMNGDREDNRAANLTWRPRWFAIRYHQQFRNPYRSRIDRPIVDLHTGEVSHDSLACAIRYGLLEQDLVESIIARTYVWPTYQQFGVADV